MPHRESQRNSREGETQVTDTRNTVDKVMKMILFFRKVVRSNERKLAKADMRSIKDFREWRTNAKRAQQRRIARQLLQALEGDSERLARLASPDPETAELAAKEPLIDFAAAGRKLN